MLYCFQIESLTKTGQAEKGDCMDNMTRLELLTLLYSLRALINTGNVDEAKKVIDQVIAEAERQQ